MSKREASEYLTKEHGSTANTGAAETKPTMATSAQLARRKIATPKGRLQGGRSTPTASSMLPNPFASQPQQTFGPVGGGSMVFGQSNNQQFNSAAQSGGSFSFSAGDQPNNPFNNSQMSQPPNNPFANINGANSTPFANTNGVPGASNLNYGKRSSDDMMMESPEKKASIHPFGRHQGFNWSNPQQQQQSAPIFNLGGSQSNSQPNGGLFGNVPKSDPPQQGNLFGQASSSQPAFTAFGQTQNSSQNSSSLFGQPQSKEQTPTPPPSFNGSFGQSSQQAEAPKFTFGQTATTQASQLSSSTLFGQPPNQNQAETASFGSNQSSRASSPFKLEDAGATPATLSNPFAGIQAPAPSTAFNFGGSSTSTTQEPEEAKPASSLFGQPPASKPSTGLFGQAGTGKPSSNLFGQNDSPAKPAPKFSFGQTAQPQTSAPEPKPAERFTNPFAGLSSVAPSQSPTQTASTPAEPAKSNIFNFGTPASPSFGSLGSATTAPPASSTSLFGMPKTAEAPKSNLFSFGSPAKEPAFTESESNDRSKSPEKVQEPAASKSVFGFGQQPTTSGGLFTPVKPVTTDKPPMTEPPKFPSFDGGAPLFQKDPSQVPEPVSEKVKKPLFGRTLDSGSTLSQPAAPESSAKAPLFGSQSAPSEPTSKAPLFGSQPIAKPAVSPTESSEPTEASQAPPSPKPAARSLPAPPAQAQPTGAPSKRPVYTKSPARIPNFLNGEGFKEFDNNYRLRALNREFQRRITSLDASRHDFENVVRHYVAARASIGADIGLFQRTMAGTKRKNDTVDEEELEVPQQYKKSKADNGQAAPPSHQPAQKANVFAPTPVAAAVQPFGNSAAPSKAASMFNQMIPKSPQRNPPKPADDGGFVSVFAAVPKAPPPQSGSFIRGLVEDIENGTSTAASSSSAQPAGFVPSTTPAKPPPAPIAGMPTFSSTAGNAFASFAAKAEKGAKKRTADRLEDEYSSDEDSQAEGRKKIEEEARVKRAKIEAVQKTGFTPQFGSTAKSTSPSKSPPKSSFTSFSGFSAQPSVKAPSPVKPSPSKARVGPFEPDSDDEDDVEAEADDEETTEEKDEEFIPLDEESSSEDSQDDEEEEQDDLPEDEVHEVLDEDDSEGVDRQAEIDANPNKGKSLFDRVESNPEKPTETPVNGERNEYKSVDSGRNFGERDDAIMGSAKNNSFKPGIWGSNIGKSTPEQPGFSPITPATASPYKPASTFNFTAAPPMTSPTPVPGASVLSGGLTANSYTKFDGMFGSRPTTPNPLDKDAPTPAAPVDHTWNRDSPIKFGTTPEKAPKISLTEASPAKNGDTTPKAPFGSLFGTPAPTNKAADSNLGFSFGGAVQPSIEGGAKVPDWLHSKGVQSSLAPGSGISSGLSSRGTSPGLTDNESVATDVSDNMPPEPQSSLMESRAGEENEECLYESRSKGLKYLTEETADKAKGEQADTWKTIGVGILRLLKNKDTGKCRVLFRAEPSGNILVNENLLNSAEFTSVTQKGSGAVKGALWNSKAERPEKWVFKVKTGEMADELAGLMEANRAN